MAKRHRNHQVAVAFHYLVKSRPNEDDPENPIEEGFSNREFQLVLDRLRDLRALDDKNDAVVNRIKLGEDLPFLQYEEVEEGLHFGDFEGAYYGQRYRNNHLGVIEAHTLNMRGFHYLITKLRDGRILVGTTYHGQFGDYDGLKTCLSYLLQGNYRIASKTLKSVSGEIGSGHPVSVRLNYRKSADRAERRPLFGSSGVIALRAVDFGDDFDERVAEMASRVRGSDAQRRKALARIVSQGQLLELDEDDIVGCSAIVRENGRERTVYFLGGRNFSTKFPLNVDVRA